MGRDGSCEWRADAQEPCPAPTGSERLDCLDPYVGGCARTNSCRLVLSAVGSTCNPGRKPKRSYIWRAADPPSTSGPKVTTWMSPGGGQRCRISSTNRAPTPRRRAVLRTANQRIVRTGDSRLNSAAPKTAPSAERTTNAVPRAIPRVACMEKSGIGPNSGWTSLASSIHDARSDGVAGTASSISVTSGHYLLVRSSPGQVRSPPPGRTLRPGRLR